MAFKFGSALFASLGVPREAITMLQLAPEPIFRVVSAVTEKEFWKKLASHDVSY